MKTRITLLGAGAALIAIYSGVASQPDATRAPLFASAAPEPVAREGALTAELEADASRRLSPLPSGFFDRAPEDLAARFASLVESCESRDLAAVEASISAWIESSPDPTAEALGLFDALEDRGASAEAVGLMLQACMLFAEQLPDDGEPWTRARIAMEILARHDASPRASRVVRLAVKEFAQDIPVEELGLFVRATASDDLQHIEDSSMLQRLYLIQELAAGMHEGVVDELAKLICSTDSSTTARGIGANALMTRDWRIGGQEMKALLDAMEEGGETANLDLLRASAGGNYLELHGRDRLELLREVVGDERTTDIALGMLDRESAELLDAFANEEDRAWDGYAWVELALGGERGYEAGMQLVERLDGEGDQGYVAQVLKALVSEHLGQPGLTAHLQSRFEARGEAGDPYWGTLLSMSGEIDEAFFYLELLPRLELTRGERSFSRGMLVAELDSRFPELGLASL